MVCLCGRIVSNNLISLLDDEGRTVLFSKWQQHPVEELYDEISAYNTFRRMIVSLRRDKPWQL
jgi:ABC-type uncharacterized transport system ATPase subunit